MNFKRIKTLHLYLTAAFVFLLPGCTFDAGLFDAIKNKSELVVLTTNSPTTWFIDRDETHAGPEHDMARAFAKYLGVAVRFQVVNSTDEIFQGLRDGKGDIAASGLTVTPGRSREFDHGPVYQAVSELLICHRQVRRVQVVEDIKGLAIVISKTTSYVDTLSKNYPELNWTVAEGAQSVELLKRAWQKKIECTVVDSTIFNNERRYYPELKIKYVLANDSSFAWMYNKDNPKLTDAITTWLNEYKVSNELANTFEKYYGHIEKFDYVDVQKYLRRVKSRLPKYKKMFQKAAIKNDLSWTLLAAQSYQESHWNRRAKSPTGVRGIMMLTRPVAKSLGVTNRLHAKQNIYAGAKFMTKMKNMIDENVVEPERSWLALAAYNVGRGHFRDAQSLARKQGKNPNQWVDMKEILPLLSKKEYYKDLKYGYARGNEPVLYVTRIRDYQFLLELYLDRKKH